MQQNAPDSAGAILQRLQNSPQICAVGTKPSLWNWWSKSHLAAHVVDGVDPACVIQNALGKCGLPTVDVGRDAYVAGSRDVHRVGGISIGCCLCWLSRERPAKLHSTCARQLCRNRQWQQHVRTRRWRIEDSARAEWAVPGPNVSSTALYCGYSSIGLLIVANIR